MFLLRIALISVATLLASQALGRDRGSSWLDELDRTHMRHGAERHVHSTGVIEEVQIEQGTVTMRHVQLQSPDKSIWMPEMRMVFHTTNRRMLRGLKSGDRVAFEAVRLRNAVMVTNIRTIP